MDMPKNKDDVKNFAYSNNLTYEEYDTSPTGTCVEVDLGNALKGFWYYNKKNEFESFEKIDAYSEMRKEMV